MAVESYSIVELSGELRARQEELLRGFVRDGRPLVQWLDRFPQAFSGVVLGNEVLDAMPVRLLVKTESGWDERGVALSDAAGRPFAHADRPCDPALAAQIWLNL